MENRGASRAEARAGPGNVGPSLGSNWLSGYSALPSTRQRDGWECLPVARSRHNAVLQLQKALRRGVRVPDLISSQQLHLRPGTERAERYGLPANRLQPLATRTSIYSATDFNSNGLLQFSHGPAELSLEQKKTSVSYTRS